MATVIHHFVLLKVFECPAAAAACFCYLVTQMEVFNFKSTDLNEQLPLLPVPLQTVTAEAEVRCVVFVCFFRLLRRWPPRDRLRRSAQAEGEEI